LDRYWWGGMSFGPRRFVDLAVPMMIGLGWLLARTRGAGGVAAAAAAAWGAALAAAAAAWGAALAAAAAAGSLDLSGDLAPRELMTAVASIDGAALADSLGGAALLRAPWLALSGLAIVALVSAALWPAVAGA